MQYTWDCSDVFPYESKGRCISCKHTRAALSTHGLHFVNVMIKSNSDMPIMHRCGCRRAVHSRRQDSRLINGEIREEINAFGKLLTKSRVTETSLNAAHGQLRNKISISSPRRRA